MENVKKEMLQYVSIGVMLALWIGVLLVSGTPLSINWEAVKKLPDAVTIFVILSAVFTKWLWRFPPFN